MKITNQLHAFTIFLICCSGTVNAMRRVKSTSNLPTLETITENQDSEPVSAPTSPLSPLSPSSPLSHSFSTADLSMASNKQTPQPKRSFLFLSIKNPFPYELTLYKKYIPSTSLTNQAEPLIFEQKVQPGWKITDPIDHELQLGQLPFALLSISIIDPQDKTVLKEITGPERYQNFLDITIQVKATTAPSPKISRKPSADKIRGIHVRRGEKRPTSPSVILPPQSVLNSPSLPMQSTSKRPPQSSSTTRTQSRAATPSDLSVLPTTPPASSYE